MQANIKYSIHTNKKHSKGASSAEPGAAWPGAGLGAAQTVKGPGATHIGRVLGLVRGILMQGLVQRRLFKGTTIIVHHNDWGNDCVPLKSYSSPPPQLTTIIIIVVIDHAIIMIPQGIMT